MTTFLVILLAIYLVGILCFMVAVFTEAPKHEASIGALHVAVAVVWPFWVSWYLWLVVSNWIASKRKNKNV